MEILKKIFLIIFFGIVFLFVGLSIYVQQNGKALIEEKLSAALQKEVHVGKARLIFPLGLRFDNVEIKQALSAKLLRIHFGIPFFLDGHLNITKVKLTEPEFFLTYSADKKITLGQESPVALLPSAPLPVDQAGKNAVKISQGIIIDYLEIKEGQLKFFDLTQKNMIDVGHVNLKAMEVALPAKDIKTRFDLSAVIASDNAPFAGQKIEARGIVNIVNRDMDAVVKVVDPAGNAGLSAQLKSVNNDMTVQGKINVGRFVAGIKTKNSRESSLEGFLASAIESSGVDIGLDFICETKMDDFKCEKIGLGGKVVQNQKKP